MIKRKFEVTPPGLRLAQRGSFKGLRSNRIEGERVLSWMISDPSRLNGTMTRVEVHFGTSSTWWSGRRITPFAFGGLIPKSSECRISRGSSRGMDSMYLIDPDGMSFVLSERPSWREAFGAGTIPHSLTFRRNGRRASMHSGDRSTGES